MGILFRGKRKDNMEWISGDLIQSCNTSSAYILPISESDLTNIIEIIPETIGQLMPIKDTDGLLLFEGDIVSGLRTPDNFNSKFVKQFPQRTEYRLVGYSNCEAKSVFELPTNISYSERSPEYTIRWRLAGNKWDNPELIQSL